jgi:acyl dehydratase
MASVQTLGWRLDRVGEWGEPQRLEVTRERIVAYAEATNDDHPAHRSGDLAPPVFPVVETLPKVIAPALMAIVPEEVRMRVVHGEQDFRYHRPIRPGDALLTRAAAVGVHGTSSGVVVLGKGVTEDEAGELVVEQYMAGFFRGAELDVHLGEALTSHAFDESLRERKPDATVVHRYDPDQPKRYSEASGDMMPIHLDDEFARSMGLPGIIVHGLNTMAFCGRAVVQAFCNEDPTRLTRFAVRFSNIVQPSETVTHSLLNAGDGRIAFETTSDKGTTAIKDGLATIDS